MEKFDVIVIGSGGGAKISTPAARLGLKVACIEKGPLGGTCLNRGCIPSKMLIHPADVAVLIREARKFDILNHPEFSVDFAKLVHRISATVDGDSSKIAAGYRRNKNLTHFPYEGRFIADKVIRVNGQDMTAPKIFIAVGSRPHIPAIPGLIGTPFMTSTEALRNPKLPRRLVIIGGGYIAAELGHAYGALGSEVHLLVRRTMLRHEDSEVAQEFYKIFSRYHSVHEHALPTHVQYNPEQFTVHFEENGVPQNLTADELLIATGVIPNTDTLDLHHTRIACDEKGFIKVDTCLRTNVEGVYAFGDCIGRHFYRHTANFEGEYLFENVFANPSPEPVSYPPVPHAIFSHPQIAAVGKTEDELKAEGADYLAAKSDYASSGMGMAMLAEDGFVKILIDRGSLRILGAHIIGPEASNMIHMLIALMSKDGTLEDLLKMIYIHPALPEIVRNTARKAKAALMTEHAKI